MAFRFMLSPTGDFLVQPGAPTNFLGQVVPDVDPDPVPEPSLPTIAISAASTPAIATEGTHATVSFAVTLSGAAPATVSYGIQTENGSALAGQDYTAVSATRTIAQGDSSDSFTVTILTDDTYRAPRSFTVALANAICNGQALVITNGTGSCSIIDDEEPVVAESPIGGGVHPRIWVVPEAYAGVEGACTPSQLRARILAHYAAEFQQTINSVNQRLSANLSTQDLQVMLWDGFNCAMFALLDPATMPTLAWGGVSRETYAGHARSRVLSAVTRDLLVTSNNTDGSDPERRPTSSLLAATYDWSYAAVPSVWSTADQQALAEGAITAHSRRVMRDSDKRYLSAVAQRSLCRATPIGVAMAGDAIPGTASNGQPFTSEMWRLADQCFDDYTSMCQGAEYYYDGAGQWSEGDLYARQAIRRAQFPLTLLSTAYADNFFTRYGWLRTYPLYCLQSVHPVTYTGDKPRSLGIVHKASSTYEMPPAIDQLNAWPAFLEAQAPAIGRAVTHWRTTRSSGVQSTTSTRAAQNWPWHLYLYGHRHMEANAPSAIPSDFPLAIRHGMGEYCVRTTNEYDPDATVLWFWAMDKWLGGHQQAVQGMIELHRNGQLLVHGGTHKNWGGDSGISNNQGAPETDACTCRIGSTGETPGGSMTVRYAPRSVTGDTSLHPLCALDSIRCWTTTDVADLNQTTYHYIKYDQSATWPDARCTFHTREVVSLKPIGTGGQPYVYVLNRVTRANADTGYIVDLYKVPFRPSVTDGAALTLVEGPGTGDSTNPDSEGASGVWTTPARAWSMTNDVDGADGRLFAHHFNADAILRIVGGDKNGSHRDLSHWDGVGCRDTNRCDSSDTGSAAWPTGGRTYVRRYVARWTGGWSVRECIDPGTAGLEHVLDTLFLPARASVTAAMPDVTAITSGDGTMTGFWVDDPGRARVVLRPVAHEGTAVTTAFSYTVTGLGSSALAAHVFLGLDPSTAYQVSRVGAAFTVTPGSGPYTSTANGTLEVTL